MCYTNIKPAEQPKKKFYWKIIQEGEQGGCYGMFTFLYLPKNCWIKAFNFSGTTKLPRFLRKGGHCSQHAYLSDFKGFGVFASKRLAVEYLTFWENLDFPHWNAKIVKVLCDGSVTKATTENYNDDNVPAVPCYIFDKIKIVE